MTVPGQPERNAASATRSPTRAEIAEIRALAQTFVKANDRRNPTSEHATLAEDDAIFNLRWRLNELGKACSGGR